LIVILVYLGQTAVERVSRRNFLPKLSRPHQLDLRWGRSTVGRRSVSPMQNNVDIP
jgi:hypothetical protein